MRLISKPAVLVALIASGLTIASAQTAPEFQFRFTEKPGPYRVGFKVIEQYDRSRVFQIASDELGKPTNTAGPRPLQTLVWYPAEKSSAKIMTFGDYAALIKTETSFSRPVDPGQPQTFIEQYMHGVTALKTWAFQDAPTQEGRFPLVIYAPSINTPATENIELCEYLASHGFVVISSPSMGAMSRAMADGGENAQAKDISFEIDFARTLPNTEMSAVAVIGYSIGGISALFAAARDQRIDALVSLDGSFRYAPGAVQDAGDVHPDRMTIPLLAFSRAEETLESWDAIHQSKNFLAPNVLNEWIHGDLLHVHLLAISHIQFSSLYQRSERFRKEALQFSPADYSLEDGAVTYNWIARYTLEFLNAYMKKEAAAMVFLKHTPTENGVPKHLMAASFRAASSGPVLGEAPSAK